MTWHKVFADFVAMCVPGDSCLQMFCFQSKNRPHLRGEYNVYSTFQSHEPEFDYLKSLEIEEKINKIRWLPQQNAAHFLLSTNGKGLPCIYFDCFDAILSHGDLT